MANAIAETLQSVTQGNATIVELEQADGSWLQKVRQITIDATDTVCLVFPHDIKALAAVVEEAAEKRWQIIPCGNGSKLDWGGLTKEIQLIVSTQKCDRIIQHAVDDLTVTVEAGVKIADLQARLKATNQFLPIDPAFLTTATVGGIIATADTGSWRYGYGGIRDLVLGISFVRGDGEIAKAGGKVVKNVAGYDLMKLFIGSYGTLGIITQVTFRTYPIPQASQTVAITGETTQLKSAIKLLRNSGLTPTAMDLISSSVAKKLSIADENALLIRFQTIPESIKDQTVQLTTMFDSLSVEIATFQEKAELQLWHQLTDLVRIAQTPTAAISKLGILPTEAVSLLEKISAIDARNLTIVHLGGGVGILQFADGVRLNIIQTIREFCQSNSGFLSVSSAPKEIKQQIDVWGYSGNALDMMQRIQQKFDPQNIFNSDRFF